jgi:ABC-type bacteriocin/lantibiotic exporter with double-glycine peptidase domain
MEINMQAQPAPFNASPAAARLAFATIVILVGALAVALVSAFITATTDPHHGAATVTIVALGVAFTASLALIVQGSYHLTRAIAARVRADRAGR